MRFYNDALIVLLQSVSCVVGDSGLSVSLSNYFYNVCLNSLPCSYWFLILNQTIAFSNTNDVKEIGCYLHFLTSFGYFRLYI